MGRLGAVVVMALSCGACASVGNSASIPEQWLGRWVEEPGFCDSSDSENWDLILTQRALSFRNERGVVRSAYATRNSLLVVVADGSGLATQYRSYDLLKHPTDDVVAVTFDTKRYTLQRCPAGS